MKEAGRPGERTVAGFMSFRAFFSLKRFPHPQVR
jgi:hypothetical protein